MIVLLRLKSRLIGEVLYELLNKDNGGDFVIIVDIRNEDNFCKPDIVIVDHGTVNEECLTRWPEAKFILLDTGLQEEKLVSMILIYSLHGIISTDEDAVLVKKALKSVHEGQVWINNNHLKALLYKAGSTSRSGVIDAVSKREKQVVEQIAKGKRNKEIAEELFMSEQTVKAHISHIFKKLNVSSRTQLISLVMNSSSQESMLEV